VVQKKTQKSKKSQVKFVIDCQQPVEVRSREPGGVVPGAVPPQPPPPPLPLQQSMKLPAAAATAPPARRQSRHPHLPHPATIALLHTTG
jgi:hypothetical protein